MNIALKPSLAAMLVLCFTACSSSHYKLTLRDGREFYAANRPEFSSKTGYYRFRNLSDKDALLRADEVLSITEQ